MKTKEEIYNVSIKAEEAIKTLRAYLRGAEGLEEEYNEVNEICSKLNEIVEALKTK